MRHECLLRDMALFKLYLLLVYVFPWFFFFSGCINLSLQEKFIYLYIKAIFNQSVYFKWINYGSFTCTVMCFVGILILFVSLHVCLEIVTDLSPALDRIAFQCFKANSLCSLYTCIWIAIRVIDCIFDVLTREK